MLRKIVASFQGFRMTHVTAFQFLSQKQPLYLAPAEAIDLKPVSGDCKQSWKSYIDGKRVFVFSHHRDEATFTETAVRNKKLESFLKTVSQRENVKLSTFNTFCFDQSGESMSGYNESIGVICEESVESDGDSNHAISKIVENLSQCTEFGIVAVSALRTHSSGMFSLSLIDESPECGYCEPIIAPVCHPAFVHPETNSICHNIQMILERLEPFVEVPEVLELKKICLPYLEGIYSELPLIAKNPVIVIEGLDATGKTTLTSNLALKTDAHLLKSPPENVAHLREAFDKLPAPLRRLFFFLSNYVIAAMIRDCSQIKPIVCDRFWHSSAAYAIATDVKIGDISNLPPVNHWVYKWPQDLLKPSVVYYLHVNERERMRRLTSRDLPITEEEKWLVAARARVHESYCRMVDPGVVKIDASGTPDEVCQLVYDDLKSRGLI